MNSKQLTAELPVDSSGNLLCSKLMLSKQFNLDRRTVDKRLQGVNPIAKYRGNPVWLIKDASPYLLEFTEGYEEERDPEKMIPDDRDKYYASELKKQKVLQGRGELAETEEMEDALADTLKKLLNFLGNMTDTLSRGCNFTTTQQKKIDAHCENIRATIYDEMVTHIEIRMTETGTVEDEGSL